MTNQRQLLGRRSQWCSRPLASWCVAGAFTLLVGAPLHAATFTVTSTLDAVDDNIGDSICHTALGVCTLRAAIQEANALAGPDTIDVAVVGTIKLTIPGGLTINDDVSINGDGHQSTIIDGNKLDRVFLINSSTHDASITGVTIKNGKTSGDGGGIEDFAALTLSDVVIQGNHADGRGGGIYNHYGNYSGTVTIGQASCLDSYVSGLPGAIISGNSSASSGGGIYNDDTLIVNGSVITGNIGGDASAIHNAGAAAIFYTSIDHNAAPGNATIWNNGTLDIEFSSVASNNGAGILGGLNGPSTALFQVTVVGNKGGGILNNSGSMTISGSAVLTNTNGSGGAGVFQNGGTMSITNTTIARNKSTSGPGGGIFNHATLSLTNVTLADNVAPTASSISTANGTANVRNTIVKGKNNCDAPVAVTGNNIESENSCGFTALTDKPNTDPLLVTTQDPENGFEPFFPVTVHVPLVASLKRGSPAVDAGDNTVCPPSDQRTVQRPIDGNGDGTATCDIGAYELQ